jgi:hypothetical protein
LSADSFLCDIWRDDPELALTTIEEQAADLRDHDTESVLEVLTAHVPDFPALARSAAFTSLRDPQQRWPR